MKIINKKLNKLTYITYQVFPNEKANTIQTIRMLDSINTFDIKTKLIFPDRKGSNQELGDIKKFYQVEQDFERILNSIQRIDEKIDKLQTKTYFE